MSTDPNPNPADLPVKPMKGKYDGRKNNGATKARRRVFSNLGRKPNWAKHVSRNQASSTLREFDAIATPADIYAAAWEKGKFELCADMYKQFQDRLQGRPFIAENPNLAKKQPLTDPRLAIAIEKLLPRPKPKTLQGVVVEATVTSVTPDASQPDVLPESTQQVLARMEEIQRTRY